MGIGKYATLSDDHLFELVALKNRFLEKLFQELVLVWF